MTEYKVLDSIRTTEDLKRLPKDQLPVLAEEIRAYMVDCVSKTGGHLASSLGAVEIIIAMHRVFNAPEDKIIFDVGHQAYAHKILTGRKDRFPTLRQKDGISGFPKREESEYDAFNVGHASTSISAALGYARAMKLKQQPGRAVALIGDGAMTGGLALEAMNDAGQANVPIVVILNDNNMSIAENVGGVHDQLTRMRLSEPYVRTKRAIIRWLDTGRVGHWLSRHMEKLKNRIKSFLMPDLLFEQMGFTYYGPIDGHDIDKLTDTFEKIKKINGAVLVHVVTKKGKGYLPAEEQPEKYHGISPFDPETGEVRGSSKKTNSDVFGEKMMELAENNSAVVAITAAMPSGTGLNQFKNAFPGRFFDVGICEEHALTMAAGMAAGGLHPVVAMYSSFLQRGYDEILHDICLQKLPVVIAVDRAGLVGQDGPTHQGVYDVAFLSTIPNLAIYSPATMQELASMLDVAILRQEPAVIRFNRGSLMNSPLYQAASFGKWELMQTVQPVTIVATGCMVEQVIPVARETRTGLVNARFINPMDEEMLDYLEEHCKHIIVVEENTLALGSKVRMYLKRPEVTCLCVPNTPIPHASVTEQREMCGLSREDIKNAVLEAQKNV